MEKRKQSKRELIFDAAFSLFIKNGYENTKIIDIANQAQIGKGTVYEYFESKDELFAEMFKSRLIDEYTEIQPLLSSTESAKAKLLKFAAIEEKTIERWSNVFSASTFQISAGKNHSKLHSIIFDLMLFRHNMIRGIIEHGIFTGELKDIDPYLSTVCFLGALNFYTMHKFHPKVSDLPNLNETLPPEESINWKSDKLVDLLFDGLKA